MRIINFPVFLYGSFNSVNMAATHAAIDCIKFAIENRTEFVEPLGHIETNEIVWTNSASDFEHQQERWRLYFSRSFLHSACAELSKLNAESRSSELKLFYETTVWGALDSALGHVAPNSISQVCLRLNVLFNAWDQLRMLRYVDRKVKSISFNDIMKNHFTDLLEMWLEDSTGDIRRDLIAATEIMTMASRDEIQMRIISSMIRMSSEIGDLKVSSLLTNQSFLMEKINAMDSSRFMELSSGYTPKLLRELYIIKESGT